MGSKCIGVRTGTDIEVGSVAAEFGVIEEFGVTEKGAELIHRNAITKSRLIESNNVLKRQVGTEIVMEVSKLQLQYL